MGEAGQRVRLIHELRELRGAEELLERRHDRPDVDDRLRRDRVDVLGGHPLADDALHPVQADADRLLDQLANGAQTAVAEVLVLVEIVADRIANEVVAVGREVLRVAVQAEHLGHRDEVPDERDDVLRRQRPHLGGTVEAQALIQRVAADLRQVVALRIEEERLQEVPRVVERRRLTRALLLEDLDQRLFLARRRVLLQRVQQVDRDARTAAAAAAAGVGENICFLAGAVAARAREELLHLLVRRAVDIDRIDLLVRENALEDVLQALTGRQGPQQRGDRQLALPVDTRVDNALLVDLELEPGTT